MSLNYYKLYINQVLDLSKTMVFKVEPLADLINERLKDNYGLITNLDEKHTWKYYLNLAGLYHSTDKKIYITSLDTLETIEFNRDTLLVHRATATAYGYGTRFYRELLSQYPEHEQLIIGALYPIDINKAISADDFTVLGYPGALIEGNEVSLIDNVNKWLYGFKERWYNQQFNLTDTNYTTALLAVMYLQLPALLVTLRLRACKTAEAHSFHVREYLSSHGMLDVYLSNMTLKQALFFYRNINYIERNAGKKETFTWLVEKIMTDRNLPLSEFNMRHDISSIPDDLTPKATFRKRLLNEAARIYEHDVGFYNLAYILSKEEPTAIGNSEYRLIHEDRIKNKFEQSKTNNYQTKILESAMFDYSDSTVITEAEVALNNWIYLSQKDKYNAYIPVANPITGVSTTISVKVALILFLYAYCKAHDINVNTIPPLVATRVPIDPVPTREELYEVVDKNYVPMEFIDFIIELHKPAETIISTATFTDWVHQHHVASTKQMNFVANHEHLYTRGLVHNAVSRLYQVAVIENEFTGKSFETILKFNNIDLDGLRTNDWIRLYTDLYKASTGLDLNVTSTTSDLQKSMISLLKQLSSYSIQFVQSINQTSIKVLNWSAVRVGDVKYTGRALFQVQIALMRIFKLVMKNNPMFKIDLPSLLMNFTLRSNLVVDPIKLPVDILGSVKVSSKKIVDLGTFKLNQSIGPYCAGSNLFEIPLYKPYYDLSVGDKKDVKDIYTDYVSAIDYIPNVNVDELAKSLNINLQNIKPRLNILDSYVHFYTVKNIEAFYNDDLKVVLDGFYNNIETDYIENHKTFNGFYKANSFKYMGLIPETTEVKGETYTGGILLGPLFSIKKSGDLDLTLPLLTVIREDGSLIIEPQYLNFDISNNWYNYAHVEFTLIYRSFEQSIKPFDFLNHDLDLGTLVSPAGDKILDVISTYFNFIMFKKPTELNPQGLFKYYYTNYDILKNLTLNVGDFDVGSLLFRVGHNDLNIKNGISNTTLNVAKYEVLDYQVRQTFTSKFIDKTITVINGISHRTIPKMVIKNNDGSLATKAGSGHTTLPSLIFSYIDSGIDITNWRL